LTSRGARVVKLRSASRVTEFLSMPVIFLLSEACGQRRDQPRIQLDLLQLLALSTDLRLFFRGIFERQRQNGRRERTSGAGMSLQSSLRNSTAQNAEPVFPEGFVHQALARGSNAGCKTNRASQAVEIFATVGCSVAYAVFLGQST